MEVPLRTELEGLTGGPILVRALQQLIDQLQLQSPMPVAGITMHSGVKPPDGNEIGNIGDLYMRIDQGDTLNQGFVNPPGFLAAGGSDLASQTTPILWAKYLNNGAPTGWSPVGAFTRIATAQPGDIGTINDWVPGAGVGVPTTALLGNTIINWGPGINNDATINGIPRGYNGQLLLIRNNSASNIISFAHANTGSKYGNRFANMATSAATPVGATGYVLYEYDGTIWSMIAHEQGTWITPTFASGNYVGNGAQTWTLQSGDVTTQAYHLAGRTLQIAFVLATTTVGGTPNTQLIIKNAAYGGFTTVAQKDFVGRAIDNGTAAANFIQTLNNDTQFYIFKDITGGGNWAASTDNTRVEGNLCLEVN